MAYKPKTKIVLSVTAVVVALILTLWSEGAFADESYFYARVGLGKNTILTSRHAEWEDQGQIGGTLGLGYRFNVSGNLYADLSWAHYSQPGVGQPVDPDKSESVLDAFYATFEYRWY